MERTNEQTDGKSAFVQKSKGKRKRKRKKKKKRKSPSCLLPLYLPSVLALCALSGRYVGSQCPGR